MMEMSFEPNLKFVLELKEDLKTKYFEQYEKAKEAVTSFSHSLQNVYYEHQKILADNIELSITNEKLKQIINEHELNKEVLEDKISSEVLSASKNCNLEISSKTLSTNKKIDESCKIDLFAQKENICNYVPIFSADFDSEVEERSFEKQNSPPPSIISYSTKIQNSPILSKRKRLSSRKSNSSICSTSTHSITSNNDSKVNLANVSYSLEKNVDDVDSEMDAESVEEPIREPLQIIDNSLCTTPKSQLKSKCDKILSVSKLDYGKTDFIGKGKKLRQTTLTLKKVVPLIDVSKIDSEGNSTKKDFIKTDKSSDWTETYFHELNKNILSVDKNEKNLNNNTTVSVKKEIESTNDILNETKNTVINNNSISEKDEELIETSPAYSEKSKLRSKLSLNLKSENKKIKLQNFSSINKSGIEKQSDSKNIDNFPVTTALKQNEVKYNSDKVKIGKRKSTEAQRTFSSDDTYFSFVEVTDNKNDTTHFEMGVTDYNDTIKCETPPVKKMLMSSFDMIPNRKEKSPDFAYKEAPVRKKNERAELPGWSCRDCEKWYGHLPEEERRKRQNECSRHRGKFQADILTPESFWNPVFDDTNHSTSFDN